MIKIDEKEVVIEGNIKELMNDIAELIEKLKTETKLSEEMIRFAVDFGLKEANEKEEFTSRKILELRGDEEWKKI